MSSPLADTAGAALSVCPLGTAALVGLSVFFTALAVKFLDDLLDEPERVAATVGAPKAAAYSGLFLALGAGIAPGTAVSLFLAAYAVGMLPSLGERLPSGVPSWVESAAAVLLSAVLTGPLETAGSLLLMAAVQTADDVLDAEHDRAEGRPNITDAVGKGPAVAMAGVIYGLALAFSPEKALAVLVVTAPVVSGWAGGADIFRALAPGRTGPACARVRFRLAVMGVAAALAGALGRTAAPLFGLPERGAFAGIWLPPDERVWLVLLAACLVGGLTVGGLAAAYRRGLTAGRRREREASGALARLERRADELDRG